MEFVPQKLGLPPCWVCFATKRSSIQDMLSLPCKISNQNLSPFLFFIFYSLSTKFIFCRCILKSKHISFIVSNLHHVPVSVVKFVLCVVHVVQISAICWLMLINVMIYSTDDLFLWVIYMCTHLKFHVTWKAC